MGQGTPLWIKNNTACLLEFQYLLFRFLICLHKWLSLEKIISLFSNSKKFIEIYILFHFSHKTWIKTKVPPQQVFSSQIEPSLLRTDWSGSICIESCTWSLCWRFYPAKIYMLITSLKLESHFPSSTWNNCRVTGKWVMKVLLSVPVTFQLIILQNQHETSAYDLLLHSNPDFVSLLFDLFVDARNNDNKRKTYPNEIFFCQKELCSLKWRMRGMLLNPEGFYQNRWPLIGWKYHLHWLAPIVLWFCWAEGLRK